MGKKRKRSLLTSLIVGGAIFSVASLLANKKSRKKILPKVKRTAQKFNGVIKNILKK
jgi:gas vesicle protein